MDTGKYEYVVTLKDGQVFNTKSDKTLEDYKRFLASGMGGIFSRGVNIHISADNLLYVEEVKSNEPPHFPASGTGAYQEGDRMKPPQA